MAFPALIIAPKANVFRETSVALPKLIMAPNVVVF